MANVVAKELQAARARVAELESRLVKERRQVLAKLPSEHGFDNLDEFIKAVRDSAGTSSPGPRRGRGRAARVVAVKAAGGAKRRSRRARITPEVKDKVKAAVAAGKTGAAIAKELGISVPSVQNIKKEFGLVKARG